MISIDNIVQQALATGCLTLEAEAQLRELLQRTEYGSEELRAFMNLQRAVMDGQVRQESRELIGIASS
jgi:hypothetical protein